MQRVLLSLLAFALVAMCQTAHAQPGGGLTLSLARHDTYGPEFRRARGFMLDAIATRRVLVAERWSVVMGGGASLVGSASFGADCFPLADGRCAKSGDAAGLNALIGLAAYAGPTEVMLSAGAAVYRANEATSVGSQWRLDIMDKEEATTVGVMARATYVPASQGVKRDMYAVGLFLRFR